MAYEIKTNRGSLFKNDRKESDKHPDYTGKINVEGELRYLSAWLEESGSGKKYFSISLGKRVEDAGTSGHRSPPDADSGPRSQQDNFDSEEIPF